MVLKMLRLSPLQSYVLLAINVLQVKLWTDYTAPLISRRSAVLSTSQGLFPPKQGEGLGNEVAVIFAF